MASSYMSITQTVVSSKLCSGINSFTSCSNYTKSSRVLSTIRNGSSINPSFHLDQSHSNRSTLKHYTRVRKSETDWEESKDEEKTDREESKDEEKSGREESEDEEKSDSEEKKDEEKSDSEEKKDEEKSDSEEKKDEEDDDKKEDHREEERDLGLYSVYAEIKDLSIKEDYRAEETILKLYSDIKDRNMDGISEVIGEECQFFSNFLSKYRLLQGKKQVMAFFYWLIRKLGEDIKIVVKPAFKDGMTVGVQWDLECGKSHIKLGKGVSFHSCHLYRGKLLIKNVEMFMEPIFHIEPLRLRTMAFVVSLAEKIVTFFKPAENTRRQAMTILLLALLLLAAAAFYFTQPRF